MAIRQVGTKGRNKEELAHDEDQRDGPHAEQIFQRGVMPHHQMPGDGVQQHFQAAAGAVLGQHLDELDANDDVETAFQKAADFHLVAVDQQARHPLDERHGTEQQADEHKAREQDLQQAGRLNDAVAQFGAPAAFHMRRRMVHNVFSFSAICCKMFDG